MSKIFLLAFALTIILRSSYGIGLNCDFGSFVWLTLGPIYTCNTNSITTDAENKEIITEVNGTHRAGRTNADVLGLMINNKGMEYFPTNIVQFFPRIKGLFLKSNSISYVNNEHLIPLKNLVYLDVGDNRITSLDSNLFSGLSMQWIRFSNNNIQHVGHDFILPNSLPKDGTIYFTYNPCINKQASTPEDISILRTSLLKYCQSKDGNLQIQGLVDKTNSIEQSHSEMTDGVKSLMNTVTENINLQLTNEVTNMEQSHLVADLQESNLQLTNKVRYLQQSNVELTNKLTNLQQSNVEVANEVKELINEIAKLQQMNFELTNEVTELTNEVTDLQNKNTKQESDTRARYLEVKLPYWNVSLKIKT